MHGESHWKAEQNTARQRGKLNETGLEIAVAVMDLHSEQSTCIKGKFICQLPAVPKNASCWCQLLLGGHSKYWKWAAEVGGSEAGLVKPALSVMHAKAHNWTCQVCSLPRYLFSSVTFML